MLDPIFATQLQRQKPGLTSEAFYKIFIRKWNLQEKIKNPKKFSQYFRFNGPFEALENGIFKKLFWLKESISRYHNGEPLVI